MLVYQRVIIPILSHNSCVSLIIPLRFESLRMVPTGDGLGLQFVNHSVATLCRWREATIGLVGRKTYWRIIRREWGNGMVIASYGLDHCPIPY